MNPIHIDFSSNPSMGKAAFMAFSIHDCLEECGEASINTRSSSRKHNSPVDGTDESDEPMPEADETPTAGPSDAYWGATNPPPNVLIHMASDVRQEWVEAYQEDPHLVKIWKDPKLLVENWTPGHRFFKDSDSLLFFRDADYQLRLCVPLGKRRMLLEEAHEQAYESAHQGPEKLWQKLSVRFYWKRMKADIMRFVQTCDVCQKVKHLNFNKYGYLIPNPIPSRLYQSISMDFIVHLPWSEGYNAIYVTVDRLTKHGIFTPTTTGLDAEDFGALFMKRVACRFGLPESNLRSRSKVDFRFLESSSEIFTYQNVSFLLSPPPA